MSLITPGQFARASRGRSPRAARSPRVRVASRAGPVQGLSLGGTIQGGAQSRQAAGLPQAPNDLESEARLGYGTEDNLGKFGKGDFIYIPVTGQVVTILNNMLQGYNGADRNNLPDSYHQDGNARIIFTTGNQPTTLLPGSLAQLQNQASGVPIGAAFYRSPVVKSARRNIGGLIQVGGNQYAKIIVQAKKGNLAVSPQQVDDLVRAGFQYGLKNALQADGISLNQDGSVNWSGYTNSLTNVRKLHDQFRSGVAVQKGRLGYKSYVGKHPGWFGEPAAISEQANQATVAGNQQFLGQSYVSHNRASERLGQTVFPLRDNSGQKIADPHSPNGNCNIYGSGPGMTREWRFYKTARPHPSGNTYFCGATPEASIHKDRDLYGVAGTAGRSIRGSVPNVPVPQGYQGNLPFAQTGSPRRARNTGPPTLKRRVQAITGVGRLASSPRGVPTPFTQAATFGGNGNFGSQTIPLLDNSDVMQNQNYSQAYSSRSPRRRY